jgi:hypothetical protein
VPQAREGYFLCRWRKFVVAEWRIKSYFCDKISTLSVEIPQESDPDKLNKILFQMCLLRLCVFELRIKAVKDIRNNKYDSLISP